MSGCDVCKEAARWQRTLVAKTLTVECERECDAQCYETELYVVSESHILAESDTEARQSTETEAPDIESIQNGPR